VGSVHCPLRNAFILALLAFILALLAFILALLVFILALLAFILALVAFWAIERANAHMRACVRA